MVYTVLVGRLGYLCLDSKESRIVGGSVCLWFPWYDEGLDLVWFEGGWKSERKKQTWFFFYK